MGMQIIAGFLALVIFMFFVSVVIGIARALGWHRSRIDDRLPKKYPDEWYDELIRGARHDRL